MVDTLPKPIPAASAAQGLSFSYAGFANYDEVKGTIYQYWKTANYYFGEIDRQRVQNGEVKKFGANEDFFKAAVFQLYRACRPKFQYQTDSECVKKIVSKQEETEKIIFRMPHKVTLDDAIELFNLLTEFVEVDGISHFEKKSFDEKHILAGELERR